MKSFFSWVTWSLILLAVGVLSWHFESQANPVVEQVAKSGRQHVEIHFTGATDVVDGYLDPNKVVIQNGGMSITPIYSQDGRILTYINYGRVIEMKILP